LQNGRPIEQTPAVKERLSGLDKTIQEGIDRADDPDSKTLEDTISEGLKARPGDPDTVYGPDAPNQPPRFDAQPDEVHNI